MKWIDLPPIWLIACLWIAYELRSPDPVFAGQVQLGIAVMVLGVALMAAAVSEMRRKRTTVIPHMQPDALVTTGIFRFTRNPIYLGDALFLVGFALFWQAHPVAILLLPLFVWIIAVRFIRPEEARLAAAFGPAFAEYCAVTRRWF